MRTHTTGRTPPSILAISASCSRLGYVFLYDGEVIDWGVSEAAAGSAHKAATYTKLLLDTYSVDIVVSEEMGSASTRRGSRALSLIEAVERAIQGPGRVMLTQGIQALCSTDREPMVHLSAPFELLRSYDDFSCDNDPYGEHDFGNFEFQGETCFWKIDYYAPDMLSGAENPADPHKSLRVLTVMSASEY